MSVLRAGRGSFKSSIDSVHVSSVRTHMLVAHSCSQFVSKTVTPPAGFHTQRFHFFSILLRLGWALEIVALPYLAEIFAFDEIKTFHILSLFSISG